MENKEQTQKDLALEKKINEIFTRSLSALILLPPVVLFLVKGGLLFFLLITIVTVLSMREWSSVCGKWSFGIDTMALMAFSCLTITALFMESKIVGLVLWAIGSFVVYKVAKIRLQNNNVRLIPEGFNRPLFLLLGYLYITAGLGLFAYTRNLEEIGLETALWLFACVATSDIMAYFTGMSFKGPKLMPKVSPNKTISGLLGGMLGGAIVTYIFASYVGQAGFLSFVFGAVIAFVSQAGDLIQSAFKRYVGIKDMSQLIPGHGGILDRIDALLLASIVAGILHVVVGKSILMF